MWHATGSVISEPKDFLVIFLVIFLHYEFIKTLLKLFYKGSSLFEAWSNEQPSIILRKKGQVPSGQDTFLATSRGDMRHIHCSRHVWQQLRRETVCNNTGFIPAILRESTMFVLVLSNLKLPLSWCWGQETGQFQSKI